MTRLAVQLTGARSAVVNLLDAQRLVQPAATGLTPGSYRRDESLCGHAVATGRTVHVPDASADPRFAGNPFVHGRYDEVRMYAGVPLRGTDGHVLGTLCVLDPRVRRLDGAHLDALATLADAVVRVFELRRHAERLTTALVQLEHLATADPLTGLPDRQLFADRLGTAYARAVRSGVPPRLFCCDLDGFKQVNDVHGHDVGDAVLVAVARRLRAAMRPADTAARLAGDEFVLLCEGMPASAVGPFVHRLRSYVEPAVDTVRGPVGVGLSIGQVEADPDLTLVELLRIADLHMQADKRSRRVH